MSREALPCVVCGKALENVTDDCENQPQGGTVFETAGHYGSTAFDPMDDSHLELNVCDPCLTRLGNAGQVHWFLRKPARTRDGSHQTWKPSLDYTSEKNARPRADPGAPVVRP